MSATFVRVATRFYGFYTTGYDTSQLITKAVVSKRLLFVISVILSTFVCVKLFTYKMPCKTTCVAKLRTKLVYQPREGLNLLHISLSGLT